MTEVDTEVLIVGGGPVGLSMSIMLSLLDVDHVLIEKHPSTTYHPKARNLNTRTMEIVRTWGIDEEMAEVALPEAWSSSIAYCKDLVKPEIGRMKTNGFVGLGERISPAIPHLSSQDVYEPIWRRRAESLAPESLKFGRELKSMRLHDRSVEVEIEVADQIEVISARYLVAADGANSFVRNTLEISMDGPSEIANFVNVYFSADLSSLVGKRPAVLYFTSEPRGVFQPLDGQKRWLCQITHLGPGNGLEEYDVATCIEWVRKATQNSELEIEILSIGSWTMNATVADKYSERRCFLVGDAAHQLPPTGGFGANTGIQDAHNLAWKLSLVLKGSASESLLDTYEQERKPVAEFNAKQSLANSKMVGRITSLALQGESADEAISDSKNYGNFAGMELGYYYESKAVISDLTDPPLVDDYVADYVATSRPGHRIPHHWLDLEKSKSTLDLTNSNLVVLVDEYEGRWEIEFGKQIEFIVLEKNVSKAIGMPLGGCIILRPDGHVGWRSAGDATNELALGETINLILGKAVRK